MILKCIKGLVAAVEATEMTVALVGLNVQGGLNLARRTLLGDEGRPIVVLDEDLFEGGYVFRVDDQEGVELPEVHHVRSRLEAHRWLDKRRGDPDIHPGDRRFLRFQVYLTDLPFAPPPVHASA